MHSDSIVECQRNLSDGKFAVEKQVYFKAVYEQVKNCLWMRKELGTF